METRIIYTKIWQDSYFAELNTTEKLLFFYYLTNPKINIIALYEIQDRIVIFDIQCTKEELDDFKIKMIHDKKMLFRDDYVYIVNAHKYQKYKGITNDIAKVKRYDSIPKEVFQEFDDTVKNTLSLHREYCMDTIKNKKEKTNNKNPLIEKENFEFEKDKSDIENIGSETQQEEIYPQKTDDLQNKLKKWM